MYEQWKEKINPVDNEYLISDIQINEVEHKVCFYDYNNKRHSIKFNIDKLRRCYITYKNKQIYFITSQIDAMYKILPAYRNGDRIVSLGFREFDYYNDYIDFYRI